MITLDYPCVEKVHSPGATAQLPGARSTTELITHNVVTSPALGISPLAVKPTTSGMASSHSVTGGMYKARERIHRRVADRRLLAIPASCRRVAACNPN
ncbi:hypothetical protein KP509_31G066700 [Ceratopteris richardii]|uniref:Uncharacterized protein n=1 Tax=Ceratopteris richardii TaxID=49495 RepID=A0A8T2QZL0_CERRI|nr:hypothetical protein KP509_31G066700 [Ceratopteris richardii]